MENIPIDIIHFKMSKYLTPVDIYSLQQVSKGWNLIFKVLMIRLFKTSLRRVMACNGLHDLDFDGAGVITGSFILQALLGKIWRHDSDLDIVCTNSSAPWVRAVLKSNGINFVSAGVNTYFEDSSSIHHSEEYSTCHLFSRRTDPSRYLELLFKEHDIPYDPKYNLCYPDGDTKFDVYKNPLPRVFTKVELLILNDPDLPCDFVSKFDLTCVQNWFDGKILHTLHPEHLFNYISTINPDRIIVKEGKLQARIQKYKDRGFTIL